MTQILTLYNHSRYTNNSYIGIYEDYSKSYMRSLIITFYYGTHMTFSKWICFSFPSLENFERWILLILDVGFFILVYYFLFEIYQLFRWSHFNLPRWWGPYFYLNILINIVLIFSLWCFLIYRVVWWMLYIFFPLTYFNLTYI